MKKNLLSLLVGALLGLMVVVILNPHHRFKEEQGQLYEATFIQLPGMAESQEFDQEIPLKYYVNSELSLAEQLEAEIDMEALFRAGDFVNDEFVREMDGDGHWTLLKEGKITRYFSLRANYRISPWQLYEK